MDPRVDAIGIGVQKAATSWLFECLRAHPRVRGARLRGRETEPWNPKELHFFSRYWDRGHAWYDGLFEAGDWRNLEFSTTYFHDADAPARIRAYNPRVRLLLCLRDPVDRALSQHRHEIARGRIPPGLYDVRRALERNPSYIEQGRYGTHVDRWLSAFHRAQLCVIDYEDILRRPEVALDRACAFLDLGTGHRPALLRSRHYTSTTTRSRRLGALLHGVWDAAGGPLRRVLRRSGLPRRVRRANERPVDDAVVPPLSREERARLSALFTDEIRRLEVLLGRDYSRWLDDRDAGAPHEDARPAASGAAAPRAL